MFKCIITQIKKIMSPFMDEVQLFQSYRATTKGGFTLPLSPQKIMVLISSTSEWLKAELILEPPSGFEPGTPELGIQHLNHQAITL